MSDSSGGKRFETLTVTGFCVLAAVASLILIYSVGLLNGEQAERRNSNPHSHSETAKQKAESACVGTNPAAVFECVIGYVEASEDTAYTEQDLTAQQRAAWGALVAAFAGLLSVGISLLGLYWIKGTLDATREAVDQTTVATKAMVRQNELAEAAQRPWVAIRCEVESLERAGPLITARYSIIYENIGRMLARNFWTTVNCRPMNEDTEARITAWFSNARERREISHRVLLPNEAAPSQGISDGRIDMIDSSHSGIPERFFVIVTAVAHYKTHDDGPWHATERTFTIGIKSKDFTEELTIAKSLRNGIYGAEKIVVRRFRSGETS
jgi:hypothetical protein